VGQHAHHRLLRHQETAERADRDGLRHVGGGKIDKGAARPAAGIVDDDIGHADIAFHRLEQPRHAGRVGGVAGKGGGAGVAAQRIELVDIAGGQRDADALAGEQPRQRGAEPLAGADDQGSFVLRNIHGDDSPVAAGAGLYSPAVQGHDRTHKLPPKEHK
jgi:hypothetical protein